MEDVFSRIDKIKERMDRLDFNNMLSKYEDVEHLNTIRDVKELNMSLKVLTPTERDERLKYTNNATEIGQIIYSIIRLEVMISIVESW